jgi:hypothetical protein
MKVAMNVSSWRIKEENGSEVSLVFTNKATVRSGNFHWTTPQSRSNVKPAAWPACRLNQPQ